VRFGDWFRPVKGDIFGSVSTLFRRRWPWCRRFPALYTPLPIRFLKNRKSPHHVERHVESLRFCGTDFAGGVLWEWSAFWGGTIVCGNQVYAALLLSEIGAGIVSGDSGAYLASRKLIIFRAISSRSFIMAGSCGEESGDCSRSLNVLIKTSIAGLGIGNPSCCVIRPAF